MIPLPPAVRMAVLLAVAAALQLVPEGALAWHDWRAIKTGNFTVFHKPGFEDAARSTLLALERGRPDVELLTGNRLRNVPVVLEDPGELANGYADPALFKIHLYIRPIAAVWQDPGLVEDWLEMVSVHEYTHIMQMTRAAGDFAFLQQVFGRVCSPNVLAPLWVAEGAAVHVESRISPYQGRLNTGFFRAYLLARAKEGRFPSIARVSMVPLEYPYVTGWYLYGSQFVSWLDRKYGDAALARFHSANGGWWLSLLSPVVPWLGVDWQSGSAFGKPFRRLWKDWRGEVEAAAATFFIDGERVTRTGWYTDSPVVAEGSLWYQRNYLVKTGIYSTFQFFEIVRRDPATGREEVAVSSAAPLYGRFRVRSGRVLYPAMEAARGYDTVSMRTYGVEILVREKNLATGRDRVRARGLIGGFDELPDGRLVLSRHRRDLKGSTIEVLDGSGRPSVAVETGLVVDAVAAGGERVFATARREGENWDVYEVDLAAGTMKPLVRTPWSESDPVPAGDRLFFTANYGGTYAVYARDLRTGRTSRFTQGGYAAYAAPDPSGWLYFAGLHSDGGDIYRVRAEPRESPPLPDTPKERSTPPAGVMESARPGSYLDDLGTLFPAVRLPMAYMEVDDGGKTTREAYGVLLWGGDAIEDFPGYMLTLGYDRVLDRPMLDALVSSNYLAPLFVGVTGGNLDGKSCGFSADYPLFMGLGSGLNTLLVGTSARIYEDFTRREAAGMVVWGFGYPLTRGGGAVTVPVERRDWDSSVDREAVDAITYLRQYLPGSELNLGVMGVWDPDNPDDVFPTIRGYEEGLAARSGVAGSLDLARTLFPLCWGLWNPSLWMDDLVGVAFADAAVPEEGAAQVSWGSELHLEMKATYFALTLDLGGRVVWNREGEVSGAVFLSTPLYVGGGFARVPSGSVIAPRARKVPALVREGAVSRY